MHRNTRQSTRFFKKKNKCFLIYFLNQILTIFEYHIIKYLINTSLVH